MQRFAFPSVLWVMRSLLYYAWKLTLDLIPSLDLPPHYSILVLSLPTSYSFCLSPHLLPAALKLVTPGFLHTPEQLSSSTSGPFSFSPHSEFLGPTMFINASSWHLLLQCRVSCLFSCAPPTLHDCFRIQAPWDFCYP